MHDPHTHTHINTHTHTHTPSSVSKHPYTHEHTRTHSNAHTGLQAPALRALLVLAEVHLAAGDPHGALPHVLACLLPAQPGGLNAAAGAGAAAAAAVGLAGAGLAGAAAGGAGGGVGGGGGGGGGGRSHDLLAAEALVLLCRVWHELSDGQQLQELLVLLQVRARKRGVCRGVWTRADTAERSPCLAPPHDAARRTRCRSSWHTAARCCRRVRS